MEIDRNLCEMAVDKYGVDAQYGMLTEEFGELLAVLNQYRRGRFDTDFTPVIEEIADVAIMIEQMSYMFGYGDVQLTIQLKQEKLRKRLQK